ncbi:glycine--tRNA ligase subunit beta [Elusimicrobiota bacterium]
MNKYPLLIEIGCEDLPPENITYIEKCAEEIFSEILKEKRIEFDKIKVYTTSRRIALKVNNIASHQSFMVDKIKGPPAGVAVKDGKPTGAGHGFAKKMGMKFEDLKIEDTPRGKYVFAAKEQAGSVVRDLLKDILKEFLESFNFPVTMKWPGGAVQFPRPIRWLLVKLGDNAVKFGFGDLKSSRTSRGHYLFADKKIFIGNINDYEKVLKMNYVLADSGERKNYLDRAINRTLKYSNGCAVKPEKLMEEVNNSLEYPTGIRGEFPKQYLEMPREIIEACLIYHQRYFPVEDKDGNLLNYFVGVRDGISEFIEPIREGYEKVLVARLEDADFFLKKDREHSLSDHLKKLEGIEFEMNFGENKVKTGNLYDKASRCSELAKIIAEKLGKKKDFIKTAVKIALLGKVDLTTHMVEEFPEMEGVIGKIYARMDGETASVAEGIYQQYKPRSYEDSIPSSAEAAVVGIADRIDTFCTNIVNITEASGSKDPYGMRRSAMGLIRILVEKKWDLDLEEIIRSDIDICSKNYKVNMKEAVEKINSFIFSQIKNYLEENFKYDVVRCAASNRSLNPYLMYERVRAIEKIKSSRGFDSLITAFKRTSNILKQARERKISIPENSDARRLKEDAEKELSRVYRSTLSDVKRKIAANDFMGVLKILASIRKPVDKFFDDVLVMSPEKDLMKNRLAILKNIIDLFSPVGDISKLELK